ncbi:hypothetical protein H4R18_003417 [Coemansia javaensis]|uniref:ER membrane protein complex subunit 10 n=1 Tax=Coemansia javaensis TaxID=2761396 RepID=A0A9W8HFG8_9FUNG|nr:hypothetical protein H4R18_003417 [Coemansia javaensis]
MRALAILALLLAPALAAEGAAAAAAVSERFEVFHNQNHPAEYVQRGELQVLDDGTARYLPVGLQEPPRLPDADALPRDPASYAVVLRSLKSGAQHVLPVRRCRLGGDAAALEETFVVHETEAGAVFHIDYDAGDRANCLQPSPAATPGPAARTKVLLRRRAEGPAPLLAEAPKIDAATGKEQQPEPPRSFLAKYWIYIVPVIILLLFTGEEPQQEREGNTRR